GAVLALARKWVGDAPAAKPTGKRTFAEGGYSVWRGSSARGTRMLAFDHGPLGHVLLAAHGHAAALAIWLHVGSRPALVDAGTYLYGSGGAWRNRFRGTAVHNTLMVNAVYQSAIGGPFLWTRHAKSRLLASDEASASA